MFQRRRAVAQKVSTHLMDAEKSVDAALTSALTLAALLPAARLEAGVAAEVGHEAIERMSKATSALVTARTEMVEAHRQLAKTRDEVGLRTTSFGGLMPKAADLSEVGDAANVA